jgi:N-ethylmaleimide reductase
MSRTYSDSIVFEPYRMGPIDLANRVVMAPMTRSRAGEGDVVQAFTAEYYAQRASAGLIISEGTFISPQGKGYALTPGIFTDDQVAAWTVVTDAVHAEGGKIFAQLWHVGRISHPSLQPDGALPVAPSAVKPAGQTFTAEGFVPFVTPRALETGEIPGIVDQFRHATVAARRAGFDGVEIHGANGYLIEQFLKDGGNQRTDEYGGSIENRARFAIEVAKAVASAWSPDRVGIRISPAGISNDLSDSDPEPLYLHLVERLSELGLAYLHVREHGSPEGAEAASGFDYARLRRAFDGTYIVNNGYDRITAEAALASGRADLVAFGRPFIANPDLIDRLALNAPLAAPDPATMYGGGTKGYIDYPSMSGSGEVAA